MSYFRMQKAAAVQKNVRFTKECQEKPISVQQAANYIWCLSEKLTQYVKNGTEIEDTEIKNRFEIRMKNE